MQIAKWITAWLVVILTLAPKLNAQARCIETFDDLPIEEYPWSVSGHCSSYHGGAVRNFHDDPVHGAYLLGARSYCNGARGVYCSNTTEFYVPENSNAQFDLYPSPTMTRVEAEGFDHFFPPFATLNTSWTHVTLPPTAHWVRVTTFSGWVGGYLFPSSHVIDNVAFDRVGPPQFEFEYDEKQPGVKLLLHKYMPNDVSAPFQGYWSSYQVQTLPPDASPQIRVPGVLKQGQSGVASTIWARVIDPPDTASYVPAQLRLPDDNRDTQHRKGTLFYYDASGNRVNQDGAGVLTMRTDSGGVAGRAEILLEASHDVAGENYQVEVSTDQSFTCATSGLNGADVCAKSAVFTTWKRVYVERHSMFREGVFLADPAPAGASQIIVRPNVPGQSLPFQPGQALTMIAGAPSFTSEPVIVDPAPTDAQGLPLLPIERRGDGTYVVRLLGTLRSSYVAPPRGAPYPFGGDAVGVPGSYFTPDTAGLAAYLADMFVDVQQVTSRLTEFPHIPMLDSQDVTANVQRGSLAGRFTENRDDNVLHVFGADRAPAVAGTGPNGTRTCTVGFGLTSAGSTANASFIYVGNVEAATAGPIPPCTFALRFAGHSSTGLNIAAVAHEVTHQWLVNHDPAFPQNVSKAGHCSSSVGSVPLGNSDDLCLMHDQWPIAVRNLSQLDFPRLGLHWFAGGADSEYTQVRTHPEPVTR